MSVDGLDIALCLIGAFYAFAGYVAARAALTSHFMDRAIAAISLEKPSRSETAQTYWLLSAAVLVFAGGIALLFLIDVAAWLFLASAVGQALYLLVLAPRIFDLEDAPDAVGRRRTTNAFVIYLAATAFVVWALSSDRLTPWQEVGWPWLALCAVLIAAEAGYVIWNLARAPAAGGVRPLAGGKPAGDPSQCKRIKVMADYHCHPLWAMDDDLYGDFPPEALDLSPELARDLNEWAAAYTASLDPDDPAVSRWSEAEQAAHEEMGRPLAVRLARERPDRTIYILESDVGVIEVKPDEKSPLPPGAGAG